MTAVDRIIDPDYTLDAKYVRGQGRVFLTGTQALVRLTLMQRQRDLRAGLDTAGFVTGYRGSPLGNVDREFWRAGTVLDDHHIRFQPAVNEDLGATAVWGTQQIDLTGEATCDGVFSMWYGKGPGVDRSGDVFRHANMAGTAPNGGVLVLAGDDPACKSSTVPSQSEYALMDAQIPVFNPADVQELLDFGLIGWALSRYAGVWVGIKCITESMDSSASVSVDPDRLDIKIPTDFEMPDGGLHIRWPDAPLEQESRLQRHKLYAALAFARANRVNKTIIDSPKARLGIVTAGKSYLDVRQALYDLGIDDGRAAELGIRLYKVGMTWPLERDGVRAFAEGLEEILVVEEKRAVIENQLKEQLYNWREDVRPRVVGKFDEHGEWVLPSAGELTPARIARVIAARLGRFETCETVTARLAVLSEKEKSLAAPRPNITRIPYFCAGCPHNTSTKLPDGSHAVAGIGCHFMVTWMNRNTETFTHMGGEGANWIGKAPFVKTAHTFVNLGDGTYFHSGALAIRAAVAAKVNITYKILYNDAVAMTGGQPHDGQLDPAAITRQVRAEGVSRIAVVTDEPDKYPVGYPFADHVTVHHRKELDAVQRELRETPGVTVLVYDQTCAAEKRRRRKRGLMEDPPRRVFINEAVCEGCGDCGVQSNCVAIQPVSTELGRKRMVDQSACNKDFSCIEGFCPSFVTVEGGTLRRAPGIAGEADVPFPALPEPETPVLAKPYDIVITGIGGTGVVTIGALLGTAAHMEGKGVTVLDQTGLAQKNGAVVSHVRLAQTQEGLYAVRVAAGNCNLLLGCDMVTAGGFESLSKLRPGLSHAVVNGHETMTAAFTHDPDMAFPADGLAAAIAEASKAADFVDASGLATALLGDSIASNLFMVGYAYQKGLLPLGEAALLRAIELNGTAVAFNKRAFLWGRRAAHDLDAVARIAGRGERRTGGESPDLDGFIARRMDDLAAYRNAAYAARYRVLVDRVRAAETTLGGATPTGALTWAVARSFFKLLAYKDEYEVARLFTDGRFQRALEKRFEGDYSLRFHLAPPILGTADPATGRPAKRAFGPWMMAAFRLLAAAKGLRGTPFDPFGYSAERRLERRLIGEYEETVAALLAGLRVDTLGTAVDIAKLPLSVRGFGPLKMEAARQAGNRHAEMMAAFRQAVAAPPPSEAAAE